VKGTKVCKADNSRKQNCNLFVLGSFDWTSVSGISIEVIYRGQERNQKTKLRLVHKRWEIQDVRDKQNKSKK
jgi:hypothetical protein